MNEYIGLPLVVKNKRQVKSQNKYYDMDWEMLGNGTIVHEVKRVGLLIDRYVDLKLRIGDHSLLLSSWLRGVHFNFSSPLAPLRTSGIIKFWIEKWYSIQAKF